MPPDDPFASQPEDDALRPASALAGTDRPVPIDVREIADERLPADMRCLATYLGGNLVARCAVPPGTLDYFQRHRLFDGPRQLVLAAREEDPGLRCELYAIVPMPPEPLEEGDDEAPPWAASVPSSDYERVVAEARAQDEAVPDAPMAAVLLGHIVRFQRDRKHPASLPLETVDVLTRIVSGQVVEAIDKVLDDLLDA